jgi:mannose-6-phosphate isomerase-like protein (cupin superfamily)
MVKMAMAFMAALALGVPASTLTGDKAEVIPAHEIHAQLAKLAAPAKATGSSGSTLASYGNLALKLSVRTTSGGGEIHAHYDDLMIVQQGKATLVIGGTITDAKMDSDGETRGSGILNGKSQAIAAGDVILVPAGVPHQLLIPPGTTYSAMVAKVKE